MSTRRWLTIAAILAGIGLGTWGLTRKAGEGTNPGQLLPDLRVLDLQTGDSVGLRSDFAGHVTLINLWATWCGPCLKEMPSIEALYQTYRDRGLRIAGVSLDNLPPDTVLAFARGLGTSFEIFHDQGNLSLPRFAAFGLPYSLLVDSDGVIRYVALGAEDWNSAGMQQRVEKLLPEF